MTPADPTVADEPVRLRWGLNDVLWGDDDTVIVCMSGPGREPYWLELDPEQAAVLRQDLAGPEAPLSPYYSHEACGFHWHGRDGMDIPIRDGQPVCPRCELNRLNDATPAVGRQDATQPTPDEAELTAAERQFLSFALDLAFDAMVSGDGFTDEDDAAMARLRRLAAGAES